MDGPKQDRDLLGRTEVFTRMYLAHPASTIEA